MLTEIRKEIADNLTAAGVRAKDYTAESITPPCAVVIPGSPYLATQGADLAFGEVRCRVDVLLAVSEDTAKGDAKRIDSTIEKAAAALEPYDYLTVSRPDVVRFKGVKYLGAVITIQHDTRLPEE